MSNQRGLAARIERFLEDGVGDVFARVFGGSIVPQELEALLRREASDGVRRLAGDRMLAPNEYVITLGPEDFRRLSADREFTAAAFARHLAGYIGDQGWQTYGDVVVRLEPSHGLHTGQYRARAVVNPDADPRPSAPRPQPGQSRQAYTAESGVPAMTDNPGYRGGPGQGRPEDYYDDQYGHPQDEQRGPEPRPAYPDQGYAPAPQQYQAPSYDQGYPPRPGYPEQGYTPGAPGAPGYGGQGYDQRPPAGGYPPPGYDQGYRQPPQGYGPPQGQPQYGPPPGYAPPPQPRYDDPGYGRHEQARPGYDQGYQPAPPSAQPGYGGYPQQGYEQGYDQGYAPPAQSGYDQGGYAPGYDQGYAPPPAPSEYDWQQGGQQGYSAHSVTLQLDDGSGRTYQLREGANVIGRGQDAQFRLPDTGVSRRHLEIRWDGSVALLSDLNSTNGTTVNNAPVQEWQLADGDVIRVGHSEIIVHVR